MKKKLLISFSGGETSAYMTNLLVTKYSDVYEMVIVFANTGQENEETLNFVKKCEVHFKWNVIWVESVVYHNKRKSNGHKIVDFYSACRNIDLFEAVIQKHGIPNQSFPHCTRELKLAPINSYMKSIGWKKYFTAIGIRADEIDRVNPKHEKLRLMYPLVSYQHGARKNDINKFWSEMPFRLELKGYHGNCITCWKKSDNKLFTIAKENPKCFIPFSSMEERYKNYTPERRLSIMKNKGKEPVYPVVFFRKNRSALEIVGESVMYSGNVIDDAIYVESCDIFSNCGDI